MTNLTPLRIPASGPEEMDPARLLDAAEKDRNRWKALAEDRRKMWEMDRDLCVELSEENRVLRSEMAGLKAEIAALRRLRR
jgi:hypothetical protein